MARCRTIEPWARASTANAEGGVDGVEVLPGREHAVVADQRLGLQPERGERHERHGHDAPVDDLGRQFEASGLEFAAEKPTGDPQTENAMPRYPTVQALREDCESRHVPIGPEPGFAAADGQRPEGGVGARRGGTRREQPDGRGEVFGPVVGVLVRDILIGEVFHVIAGDGVRVVDGIAAETAFAVVHQPRSHLAPGW